MQRFKLAIAYIGTNYHGWQVQHKDKNLNTVQAELEKAASILAKCKVHVQGSGRTDAGVHADRQIAHMDIPSSRVHINWQKALNAKLPPDIQIISAEKTDSDFHAQFAVSSKIYTYNLWLNYDFVPPKIKKFVWVTGPINLPLMEKASKYLLGEHDFAALQNKGTILRSTIRNIYKIQHKLSDLPFYEQNLTQEYSSFYSTWYFQANGFLKQMVRNIISLLVAVGKEKIPPEQVKYILENKDRNNAPATAPARGLCLQAVYY